jgi:uncharacterized protein YecE (DUF72 family)
LLDFHLFFTYFVVMIIVGTSGFQYSEWASVFYPRSLGPKLRLRYYARHFRCCEMVATYYRIPETVMIHEFTDEIGGDFQYVFRAPFRLAEERPDNRDLARKFAAVLWPLKEAGQLAGALLQFPPEFAFIRDNFDRLCRTRDFLEGIPLIAEFGCSEWLTPRAAKHLAAAHIALACVDGGEHLADRTFFCATSETAYVRFQGRNRSRWVKGDGSAQHDYLYSRAELEAAVPEIRHLEERSERVLVFFGNHWRGQAVVNARMLLKALNK